MKILTSTAVSQDPLPSDFTWTDSGEILTFGNVCDGATTPGHSCGCERSFTGLGSAKGTTFGIVTTLDENAVKNIAQKGHFVKSWSKSIPTFFEEVWEELQIISDEISHLEDGSEVRIKSTPTTATFIFPK